MSELSDWALVASTIALVGATAVLAWATKSLVQQTRQLVKVTETSEINRTMPRLTDNGMPNFPQGPNSAFYFSVKNTGEGPAHNLKVKASVAGSELSVIDNGKQPDVIEEKFEHSWFIPGVKHGDVIEIEVSYTDRENRPGKVFRKSITAA